MNPRIQGKTVLVVLVETGQRLPGSVVPDLGKVVGRGLRSALRRRRTGHTGGEAPGAHQDAAVRQCDRGRIPATLIHFRLRRPGVRDRVVRGCLLDATAVEQMSADHQQPTIRQKSMIRTEQVDRVSVCVSWLLRRGRVGAGCRVEEKRLGRMLIQGCKGLISRVRPPAPIKDFSRRKQMGVNGNVLELNHLSPLALQRSPRVRARAAGPPCRLRTA